MTSRTDHGYATIGDSPAPQYRTTRDAVPSNSSLRSLDTIGAVMALVMLLGPLIAGAFFVPR